jgi:hypothetical protein
MYRVDGETDLVEEQLSHWEGYRGSAPVRIGNGSVGVERYMDTKNEVVFTFDCEDEIDGLTVDPPAPPGMWIQCFTEGGECIGDESGFFFFFFFFFFDVAPGMQGEIFIRLDGPIDSGTPFSGTFFPNGFESGSDFSTWQADLP